jgi:hypothetical protein
VRVRRCVRARGAREERRHASNIKIYIGFTKKIGMSNDISGSDVSEQDISCQGDQIVGESCVCAKPTCDMCECGEPATMRCDNCKRQICDDSNCGADTVDGYLCGTYTQWGCGKKYTTCDECLDDKGIHEGDMIECEVCGVFQCEACDEAHECEDEEEEGDEED